MEDEYTDRDDTLAEPGPSPRARPAQLGTGWKRDQFVNIALIIGVPVVIFVLLSLSWSPFSPWSSVNDRTIRTLRLLGSAQLAYQWDTNLKKYGSFQAVANGGYLPKWYRPGKIIDHYSITWRVQNEAPVYSFERSITNNRFTIIARPIVPKYYWQVLRTFAITEDQTVRVYDPDNEEHDLKNPRSWDPIL